MNKPTLAVDDQQTATFSTGDADNKFVAERFENIKSDLLVITHDKLENTLLKFYQHHTLRTAWFNPLSMMVGVVLTLTTAEFKPAALGLNGPIWHALFLLSFVGATAWLVLILYRLATCWRETSVEWLIDRLKNVRSSAPR